MNQKTQEGAAQVDVVKQRDERANRLYEVDDAAPARDRTLPAGQPPPYLQVGMQLMHPIIGGPVSVVDIDIHLVRLGTSRGVLGWRKTGEVATWCLAEPFDPSAHVAAPTPAETSRLSSVPDARAEQLFDATERLKGVVALRDHELKRLLEVVEHLTVEEYLTKEVAYFKAAFRDLDRGLRDLLNRIQENDTTTYGEGDARGDGKKLEGPGRRWMTPRELAGLALQRLTTFRDIVVDTEVPATPDASAPGGEQAPSAPPAAVPDRPETRFTVLEAIAKANVDVGRALRVNASWWSMSDRLLMGQLMTNDYGERGRVESIEKLPSELRIGLGQSRWVNAAELFESWWPVTEQTEPSRERFEPAMAPPARPAAPAHARLEAAAVTPELSGADSAAELEKLRNQLADAKATLARRHKEEDALAAIICEVLGEPTLRPIRGAVETLVERFRALGRGLPRAR